MTEIYALGLGIGTINLNNDLLEVHYSSLQLGGLNKAIVQSGSALTAGTNIVDISQLKQVRDLASENNLSLVARQIDTLLLLPNKANHKFVICILEDNSPPYDVASSFLKLQLISHRFVRPHATNLSGIFSSLKNLAWTNEGAIELDELPARRLSAKAKGVPLTIKSIDKFPPMVDYIIPEGVRIADTSRVRLGAYLGSGTTVMHEGFVNFNAGCEGPNMIEGRISAGVFIGKGSDLGGGCSTMGTLSGGGNVTISVGENCLIGANAGIGIALGDRCTVEAGLYITAGTVVQMLDSEGQEAGTKKARELSGHCDLLFRRHSMTGAIQCLTNKSAIELNSELHKHN